MRVRRYILLSAAVLCAVESRAGSGAVEYWGGARSLADLAAFVMAFYNITAELLNIIATLVSLYSATQIYIKIQTGEEGFTKNISMLLGAVVYFLVMLVVFPALFSAAAGNHGGLFGLIFG